MAKKITDLNYYSASQYQPTDLWFVTDIAHQETKNTTTQDILDYIESNLNPFTGSYSGSLLGTASMANTLNYPNNATASAANTASFAFNALNSMFALTASFALNGGNGASLSEVIYQNNTFNVGDAICVLSVQGNIRYFAQATSSYIPNSNYNEVVGVVQSRNATSFTVVYNGIVNFASPPSYFNQYYNGVAYFLNGLGTLSATDPSNADSSQISKPVLIQINSSSALVVNQRGMYENVGSQITASYVYFDGSTPNGTVYNSIYSTTASYALNGGGSGSSITNYNNPTASFYFDTTPIGAIIAYTSGSAPSGWLPCDGAFYPITGANGAYTSLYNVVSQSNNVYTSFGQRYTYNPPTGNVAGNYSLNANGAYFKVPDLRGVFIRGYNDGFINSNGINGGTTSLYDSGSRKIGSIQADAAAMPAHSHSMNFGNFNPSTAGNTGLALGSGTGGNITGTTSLNTTVAGGVTGTETRPVNIALYYYIKYTQYAVSNPTAAAIANGNYPLVGDVGGALSSSVVKGIQGVPISLAAQTPQAGAFLQYDGTQWSPTISTTQASQNGYTTLPGGIIMQWGVSTINANQNAVGNTSTTAISFPVPFTTAIYNVTVTALIDAGKIYPATANVVSGSITNTGFNWTIGQSGGGNGYWTAIGK